MLGFAVGNGGLLEGRTTASGPLVTARAGFFLTRRQSALARWVPTLTRLVTSTH